MDPIHPSHTDSDTRIPIPRACDQCRQRKVRCHRTLSSNICDSCRASNLECSSNGSGQRVREAKTRVLISGQYERKIDRIDTRLDGVERSLQVIAKIITDNGHRPTMTSMTAAAQLGNDVSNDLSASNVNFDASDALHMGLPIAAEPKFEGESSLTAHTLVASEMFRREIQNGSFDNTDPALQKALTLLYRVVDRVSQHPSCEAEPLKHARAMPKNGLWSLPMPPKTAILAALYGGHGVEHLHSTMISCFRPIESFIELYLKTFSGQEELSQAAFLIVNAGLYYIFLEYSFIYKDDAKHTEYKEYSYLCQCNLETALTNLNLMLPHNYETVEALLLGACYAVEVSRASLAWFLNSTAIAIGQTLGFHRSLHSSPHSIELECGKDKKALLFWMAYSFDKSLALRLGYAPVMNDDDITISTSAIDSIDKNWVAIFRAWVAHAQVQGRIYNQLYSAAALALPISERQSRVSALVLDMRLIISDALQLAATMADTEDGSQKSPTSHSLHALTVHANLITFLGSLTLILNGAGEVYAHECLQSAREAMELHTRALEMLNGNPSIRSVYLHWGILYVPFLPFTVIFCHAVKSPIQEDMDRLASFLQSLQTLCAISESVRKLYHVCDDFYTILATYARMKVMHAT